MRAARSLSGALAVAQSGLREAAALAEGHEPEGGSSPMPARNCGAVVPRRSNLFQDTIAVVYADLAGDATIEESAMLLHRTTGEPPEVDVVLHRKSGSHEVVVSIEARASARKADVLWVADSEQRRATLSGVALPAGPTVRRGHRARIGDGDLLADRLACWSRMLTGF
jgi:hypothetical protein